MFAVRGYDVRVRRALLVTVVLLAACSRPRDNLGGAPRLMLWAWERPERLGYIDPHTAGIAYLARTVSWRAGVVTSRPRMQPLEAPDNAWIMAVVRLESWTPPLPDTAAIAREILRAAESRRVRALQVDFDARTSERDWYASLLGRVRAGLSPTTPLTITALASWCLGDPWVRALPVADAVPMLFRMGAGEPREVGDFSSGVCRSSLGVATDELPYSAPHGRRVFVFHPRPWTRDAYRGAVALARRWQ
jgi:hypothetical protein